MDLVGSRIKTRRKELKLTQTQIKEKVGISSGNMSDIENGHIAPSASTLVLLSEVLDCSIDWILTGKSQKHENIVFSDLRDTEAFKLFEKLNANDKNEVIGLMQFKIFKYSQTETSFPSQQKISGPDIA